MYFSRRFILLACFGGVLVSAVCSCSKNKALPSELGPLLPVEGKVLLGDKPLRGGILRIYPQDYSEDLCQTQAFIDTHGNYSVVSYHPYKDTGVPAGKYRVTVEPSSDERAQDGMVQGKYRSKEGSPLILTVQKNPPAGAYDLKLEVSKKEAEAAIKKEQEKEAHK